MDLRNATMHSFSGISSDDTKAYSALVCERLDAETLSYVSDIVLSPRTDDFCKVCGFKECHHISRLFCLILRGLWIKLAIIADKVSEVVGGPRLFVLPQLFLHHPQSSSCSVQPTMDSLARQIPRLSLQVARTTEAQFLSPTNDIVLTAGDHIHALGVSMKEVASATIIAVIKSRPASKKDSKPLNWSSEAITAFQRCKQALADAALLAHPSPSAPLALHVDASDYAIGGALHQVVTSSYIIGFLFQKTYYLKSLQCLRS
ncbi:retrovirus-related Pol polyprotein from transposon 17.6 [Trichonephila clavipes]|nr:retrovirus-related Pol polyprotein from transposon 17.6 [Trichonephila clavipes]